MPDLEKSTAELASLPGPPNFQRPDWSLFRTIEGLQQQAGVPKALLPQLVLKELVDNGLDAGERTHVTIERLDGNCFAVTDDGPGIGGSPGDVARLFSIDRPMVSTKLIRLPSRGALGNGLRVVAGAVIASEGSLVVTTRNRRLRLRPERDGSTTVVSAAEVDFPTGTRVEVTLGAALPFVGDVGYWARWAINLARIGTTYSGKSSPWWYDVGQFHELLYAAGDRTVRDLVSSLDGCTATSKAAAIVAQAGLDRMACHDVNSAQATALLHACRANAKAVNPKRLGAVGPKFMLGSYAVAHGAVRHGAVAPYADVPFVVEVWVSPVGYGNSRLLACVNRTVVAGEISVGRNKRDIYFFGCGLAHTVATAPAGKEFAITFNVTTPYMPITSASKAPNFRPFLEEISDAVGKAICKARRPKEGGPVAQTQKDVVLENLDDVVAEVSGDGQFRFNERQLLYRLRPIVQEELGEELKETNFKSIITDYEAERGDIPGMYREPRGTIYHPHLRQTIALGTLAVEDYERPVWTFNKLLYVEKEGFSEALKAAQWPERHDCALMSSKGFTTRACRDLVDLVATHDEPVTIFCVHDADAYGTMIYETFQEETKARGARKIRIVNLGLEPWEAVAMGLEVEPVEDKGKRKPVADYVLYSADDTEVDWTEWLQTHRVELNAMTTPEFIAWLDRKMAGYAKLVPPTDVIETDLDERVERKVRASHTERILREADLDRQVAATVAAIVTPSGEALADGIQEAFTQAPEQDWRAHVEAVADQLTNPL
jgi:hypothetical protein